MESFIVLCWFLLVLIIPFALLIIGYISYLREAKILEIILKLLLCLLIYFCLTMVAIPFMFIVVFAGAHSNPVGQALDTKGEILYSVFVFAFGIIGWLLCSFVNNGFIKPRLIFRIERGKTQSIFGEK